LKAYIRKKLGEVKRERKRGNEHRGIVEKKGCSAASIEVSKMEGSQ